MHSVFHIFVVALVYIFVFFALRIPGYDTTVDLSVWANRDEGYYLARWVEHIYSGHIYTELYPISECVGRGANRDEGYYLARWVEHIDSGSIYTESSILYLQQD